MEMWRLCSASGNNADDNEHKQTSQEKRMHSSEVKEMAQAAKPEMTAYCACSEEVRQAILIRYVLL